MSQCLINHNKIIANNLLAQQHQTKLMLGIFNAKYLRFVFLKLKMFFFFFFTVFFGI
jgi:hypothetical protein